MRPIILGVFIVFGTLLFNACKPAQPCPPIVGSWIGQEGSKLILKPDGKAQLITFFGATASDTFFARYQYDCSETPALLDLSTDSSIIQTLHANLFGLVVWSGDTSFSWHSESGKTSADRPKDFRLEDAQSFKRDTI